MSNTLLADISRRFLELHKIYRYRMKKVSDMTPEEVIQNCHSFYEEQKLTDEWRRFRRSIEEELCYCPYLQDYIDPGYCYDLQMVSCGLMEQSALPDIKIELDQLKEHCKKCTHRL